MKNAYKILYAMNGISDRKIVETKESLNTEKVISV